MAEIHDFGEKIGGARKDVWRSRGISISDLTDMTALERKNNIKKDTVWPKPDWEKLIQEGTEQALAYWQNEMRKALPAKPIGDTEEEQNNYIQVVSQLRDAVMDLDSAYQISSFYEEVFKDAFLQSSSYYRKQAKPEAEGIITRKVFKTAQSSYIRMRQDAEAKLFGIPNNEKIYQATKNSLEIVKYDPEFVAFSPFDDNRNCLSIGNKFGKHFVYVKKNSEFGDPDQWTQDTYFVWNTKSRSIIGINFETNEAAHDFVEEYARNAQTAENSRGTSKGKSSNRKGAFTPPQLRSIHRTGPDYRKGRHMTGEVFLEELKFRGGEFGNWTDQNDRQASLDMCYEALRDLARVLHIHPDDISFGGNLAIAFGARGTGGANAGAAHYEPDRQVINLTKMSGAGCLAHEWGHALDHAIGMEAGEVDLASRSNRNKSLPEAFTSLLDTMKYKTAVLGTEDLKKELQPSVERAVKGLMSWINSSKPDNLSEDRKKDWDSVTAEIIAKATSFTGFEYQRIGRTSGTPSPEVELLSQMRKEATGHVIPKDSKIQITLWARDLGNVLKKMKDLGPTERRVETDFFKGSVAFDQSYSKAGHGYWQSQAEMFARAFDCYISDKIQESGYQSQYLTAYADSFIMDDGNGNPVAAIPTGEERNVLREKFDLLIEDLKTRGILHDYEEELEIITPEQSDPEMETPAAEEVQEPIAAGTEETLEPEPISDKPVRYEQLSFDEFLIAAAARTGQRRNHTTPDKSLDLER